MARKQLLGVETATLSRIAVALLALGIRAGPVGAQTNQAAQRLVQQFNETTVFWKQFDVAKAIVALGDRQVLPKLEPWLRNEDRHLRGNAAYVFAGLGDERGFEVLRRILEDRSERPEGQGAVVGSSIISTDPTIKLPFAPQIPADRYYAAHLLGDLKDPRAVLILVPLLQHKEVNHIVPWSLGEIGGNASISPLIDTLKDPDPDMRVLAIYALERLRATEALPAIEQLMDDQEKIHFDGLIPVSEAAKEAVAKLR